MKSALDFDILFITGKDYYVWLCEINFIFCHLLIKLVVQVKKVLEVEIQRNMWLKLLSDAQI